MLMKLNKYLFWGMGALFLWLLFGSLTVNVLKPNIYWGVGPLFVLLYLFSLLVYKESLNWKQVFVFMFVPVLVVFLALILNFYYAFPFGYFIYNDIAGWKIFRIAWPILFLWPTLILWAITFTRPKNQIDDFKGVFQWSFDAGVVLALFSMMIDPISVATKFMSWSNKGAFLSVPIADFLSWFLVGFVSVFIMLLITKIYELEKVFLNKTFAVWSALFLLSISIFVIRLNLYFLLIIALLMLIILFYKMWKNKKLQNIELIKNRD